MPLKLYTGEDAEPQVYTPEEMRRLAAEKQKLRTSRTRAVSLLQIASRAGRGDLIERDPQGLIGLNDDPSFLAVAKNLGAGALDVLQRGNFAAAGLVDELIVKKSGPISALARVGKELMSGVAGIQGEKDTSGTSSTPSTASVPAAATASRVLSA